MVSQRLLVLLGLAMLLSQCSSEGESDRVSPPPVPAQTPALERQAIRNVLDLYRTALLQEDIDRLQDLLQPDTADAEAFRQQITTTFQTGAITALEMPPDEVVIAADRRRVTFQEIESVEDHITPGQHTRVFRTTFTLQQEEQDGIVTVRIAAVTRAGPLVQVTTPGQALTATPARLDVRAPTGALALARVDVTVPETRQRQSLRALESHFTGSFTPPEAAAPQPLSIQVTDRAGQRLLVPHRYRPQQRNAAVAYRIDTTDTASLRAVYAVAVDPATATTWFGGQSISAGSAGERPAGTLVRVAADGSVPPLGLEPTIACEPTSESCPAGVVAHIADLAFDGLGRLHAVFLQAQDAQNLDKIVGNGVLVLRDANRFALPEAPIFCQTVNAFDDAYPLLRPPVQGPGQVASPGARVTRAEGGAVWLFGSDGGVTHVTDNYRMEPCPERPERVEVQYAPVFRRRTSTSRAANDLLTNSVLAFVPRADGALWFGTALGVTRWQAGQFTPVPFTRDVVVRDNVATLEAFFQAVATAIFAAMPLTTVALDNVSFIDEFGRPLVKEDLVLSALGDRRGRLWVGTLGGGLRRIEARGESFQDTLHFTRLGVTQRDPQSGERTTVSPQGLGSNIIFALAEGPDNSLWAATDEGVSHIQEAAGTVTITNFSALDGLPRPVRDVAVSSDGTVWLATADGMFRLASQAGVIQGSVHDTAALPVIGADVTIPGTAVRTVTDATGRFALPRLPLGSQQVRIESQGAVGGPFIPAELERTVDVTEGGQSLAPVVLVPRALARAFDPETGGQIRFPAVPEAVVDLPAGAAHVPPGTTPAVHLTLLPPSSLPQPLLEGFTAVAAADLQPATITLTMPVGLTLPNQGALPPGRLVALLQFHPATRQYEQVGYGRVSADGTVITTISEGVRAFATVVFAVTPATAAARLVEVSGNGQSGIVGTTLRNPLRLQVQDGAEQGIPGVALTFTVTPGDGSLSATSQVTDDHGDAAVTWTLGPQPGRQEVTVVAAGLLGSPLTLHATAGSASSIRLEPIAGDGQTGTVGTALPECLRVAVRREGRPIPQRDVTFTAGVGGGRVRPCDRPGPAVSTLTLQTDARGEAAVIAILGAGPGEQEFTAMVPDAQVTVTLTATAEAGPVTRLELKAVGDDGEEVVEVVVNTPLRFMARAADRFNNAADGRLVTFRLRDSSQDQGRIIDQVRTEPDGLATITLTPTMVGRVEVVASTNGLEASFSVMVVPAFRLVRVSGNTQSGQPGEVLLAPLVVRLENQFGEPVVGEAITVAIQRGMGTPVESLPPVALRRAVQTTPVRNCPLERQDSQFIARTNAVGEACFFLQVGQEDEAEEDIAVAVAARDLPEVAPVRFLAIVGEIDTPDIPLDVALHATGDLLFVADRRSGVQVLDVRPPATPQPLRTINLDGTEVRLALAPGRAYVATNFPLRLYVLDENEQTLGRVQFPESLQRHSLTGLAVQGDFAYVVTETRIENNGTLQVVDIARLRDCREVAEASVVIPAGRPRSIAVSGHVAYVPAGEAGLLVFDIGASPPALLTTLRGGFFSEIAFANGLAYVVETTLQGENRFTVLDLSRPERPRRLGFVPIPRVTQVAEVATAIAVDSRFAYLARFASGLLVIDIRAPTAPQVLGVVDTPSQALNVIATADVLYVSDQIFGVQVIPTPTEATLRPMEPDERPTPLPFPQGVTTLVIDATAVPDGGNGTPETPYRSLTDALQAVRLALDTGQVRLDTPLTLQVRPGTYAPLTTQEIFPLDLGDLPPLTLQSMPPLTPEAAQTTVLDAAFSGDILFLDAAARPSNTAITVEGFTLTHGAHGIFMRGAVPLTLRHNRIVENLFAGISLGSNAHFATTITDNRIEQNGQEGVDVSLLSMTTDVERNLICNNGGGGISIGFTTDIALRKNTIACNGNDGIRLQETSQTIVHDNVISANGSLSPELVTIDIPAACRFQEQGCRFLGASAGGCSSVGHGIALFDSTLTTITKNTITNNRRDGILQENTTAWIGDHNTISVNQMHGLNITQGVVTISDNTITEQREDDGIRLRNATAEITTNRIIGNAEHGLEVTSSALVTLADNYILGNHQRGMEIRENSSATLRQNTIQRNASDGLFVLQAIATIDGGTFAQNTGHGIRLRASQARIGCEGHVVTITHNTGAGLVGDPNTHVELGRVDISNNLGGDDVMGLPVVLPCTP